MRSRPWISTAALFGAFAISYNLAVIVHELGHLLLSWITRGEDLTTWEILFHPFSVSYVGQDNWETLADSTRAWIFAGGMATGIAAGALTVPWALRLPPGSAARLPAWMFVANSMMLNGMYLVTALLLPWGDVGALLQLGAPRWLVATLGAGVVVSWLAADVAAVRSAGLASGMPGWKTFGFSVLGAIAYPLLIVGWQVVVEPSGQVPLAVYVVYAVAVAVWMGVAAPIARRRPAEVEVDARRAAAFVFIATVVVLTLLAVGEMHLGN